MTGSDHERRITSLEVNRNHDIERLDELGDDITDIKLSMVTKAHYDKTLGTGLDKRIEGHVNTVARRYAWRMIVAFPTVTIIGLQIWNLWGSR